MTLLLLGVFSIITSCSDAPDIDSPSPQIKAPIKVEEGMDLVGLITYSDGTPAANVTVSDGYSCTQTNAEGIYQLARHADARHVIFSYPEDCEIQLSQKGIPDFFRAINASSPNAIRQDFTLRKSANGVPESFIFYAIGDPQVKTEVHMKRFVDETIADMNQNIAEQTLPCIAVTLGDVCDDNAGMFESIAALFKNLNVKCFHTAGNHDHDRTASTVGNYDLNTIKAFENAFNPVNYSFNFGNVHFVVMDDIVYTGWSEYHLNFTDEQMEWLKQDLSYVPTTKTIYLIIHGGMRNGSAFTKRKEVLDLISSYPDSQIFAGYSHCNSRYLHADYDNLREHIVGASCGLFWYGTISGAGDPNGYGVYQIENTKLKNGYFKATRYDKGFQGRMYDPSKFEGWAGTEWENYVICNVWNSYAPWKVELYEDGVKTKDMEQFRGNDRSVWNWIDQRTTLKVEDHGNSSIWEMYRVIPNSKTSVKKVKITDDFGNIFWIDKTTDDFESYSVYPN